MNDTHPPGCQADESEEATFRRVCGRRNAAMDRRLRRLKGQRGLLFSLAGSSVWGWGNLLPVVWAMHWICVQAKRYCYIDLQDTHIGNYLIYANGERWEVPLAELEAEYGSVAVNMTVGKGEWPWSSRQTNRSRLIDELRDDRAALVHITCADDASWMDAIPWLPPDLQVLSPEPGPDDAATHRSSKLEAGPPPVGESIDRCFCRYTSHITLHGLPSHIEERLRQYRSPPFTKVSLHLRTMMNHLDSRQRNLSCAAESPLGSKHHAWHEVLDAACDRKAFKAVSMYVMSDTPAFTARLQAAFPHTLRINPMMKGLHAAQSWGAPYRTMTRGVRDASSWEDSNLFLAIDFLLAAQSEEIQTEALSSFARPIMARSLCIRRMRYLQPSKELPLPPAPPAAPSLIAAGDAHRTLWRGTGEEIEPRHDVACPRWSETFHRSLADGFDTGLRTDLWPSCYAPRLHATQHPCAGLSGRACRVKMLAATS